VVSQLEIVTGDIFKSEAGTLVNPVNCREVMGKGLAAEFKLRFPFMYLDYVYRCRQGLVQIGKPYLFVGPSAPLIINFPTKDHWWHASKIEDIILGLEYLTEHIGKWGVTSLAVPALGCGEGKLDWNLVAPILTLFLSQLQIPVTLYRPLELI
jgi:O-acetyl-ADP-ribose deacetylase (regulator of RNase III)